MIKHYPHYLIELARKLRKQSTLAEQILWEHLRGRKLGNLKFVRQHHISRYIADFYCHELKLIIELEGKIHNKTDQQLYDEKRFEELTKEHQVLRFRNEEIFNNTNEVLRKILAMKPRTLTSTSRVVDL